MYFPDSGCVHTLLNCRPYAYATAIIQSPLDGLPQLTRAHVDRIAAVTYHDFNITGPTVESNRTNVFESISAVNRMESKLFWANRNAPVTRTMCYDHNEALYNSHLGK